MNSMTGYGRGQAASGDWEATVEITSVNRRGLEIAISLPREWQIFERRLNEAIRGLFQRGQIKIAVNIRRAPSAPRGLAGPEAVLPVLRQLETLARQAGVPWQPDATLLFRIASLAGGNSDSGLPEQTVWPVVEAALKPALEDFAASRAREGEILETDLSARGSRLCEMLATLRTLTAGMIETYRDALLARLRQAGLTLDLHDDRVLKEVALFADRCDVSEELTRLDSHLQQYHSILAEAHAGQPNGRKLEFLLQELGRETNTVGSKSQRLEVTRLVLEMKNELERIREQVQNIE